MAKQDALFLLEVLIDKIVFVKSPCFSDKDFRTCVKIECPAVEPLEICDDDPGSCIAKSGGPFVKTFNSGKSCLFSLPEADITKAMSKFPIQVTVYKSLPCGCLPTKIIMGEATIDMTKEFVASRNKFLADSTNVSYEALKDSFRIVGPDKTETGEIVMFLRISCFGKLIVTRFQGASGLPNLGAGGQPAIVDRSCVPRKDFQTTDDPCVCGVAKAASGPSAADPCKAPCKHGNEVKGYGVCPPAPDPYNSMPCEDPDDTCYCSGPKTRKQEQMVCRNMDQYCLHVPKGALPSMPLNQDLKEEQLAKINENLYMDIFKAESWTPYSETISTKDAFSLSYLGDLGLSRVLFQNNVGLMSSSLCTVKFKTCSLLYSDGFDNVSNSCYDFFNNYSKTENIYRNGDTTVYMTLFNDFSRYQTAGTQATATLNKCLQVNTPYSAKDGLGRSKAVSINSNDSVYHISALTYPSDKYILPEKLTNSDIYYFSKKRNNSDMNNMGMGLKTKRHKSLTEQEKQTKIKQTAEKTKVSDGVETKGKGNTNNGKSVSIKDEKQNDFSACFSGKPEMIATVSHIQIGPKEPCPYYGMSPCQGPKCLVATPGQDEHAPVKVTTVTNPRRGVFELIIRRMTGAPLAKNELMLEWTPPPTTTTCGAVYPTICSLYPCRIPKYRVNCRPFFYKPSRCFKKPFCRPVLCRTKPRQTSPCRPAPCRPSPCRPATCRQLPCRPGPCRGAPCRLGPCQPAPCRPAPCRPAPCPPAPCRPAPCRIAQCRPVPCRPPACPLGPCGPLSCAPVPCPSKPCISPPCRSITCSNLPHQLISCAPTSCQPSPCPSVPCRKVPCAPSPCRLSSCSPPSCRTLPCALASCRRAPCSQTPCLTSPCRRSCKRISSHRRPIRAKYVLSARPSVICKKCCRPCPSSPCGSPCNLPCGSPCGTSPCGIPPCGSPPCGTPPCSIAPCSSKPCSSSPCLRRWPVGYRRPRKFRSQPKIKEHRQRISPCFNRSRAYPVVRGRSGPCIRCCGTPCYPLGRCRAIYRCPQKSYSVFPF